MLIENIRALFAKNIGATFNIQLYSRGNNIKCETKQKSDSTLSNIPFERL